MIAGPLSGITVVDLTRSAFEDPPVRATAPVLDGDRVRILAELDAAEGLCRPAPDALVQRRRLLQRCHAWCGVREGAKRVSGAVRIAMASA